MLRHLVALGLALAVSGQSSSVGGESSDCSPASDNEKFDCYPEPNSTEEACKARGCCWRRTSSPRVPWCFYPKNYGGYTLINQTETDRGKLAFWNRTFPSGYPSDIRLLRFDVEYQTDERIRVKISDAERQRFEPFYPKIRSSQSGIQNRTYKVDIDPRETGFKVIRGDGDVIFNSQNVGGFIYADQFMQISSPVGGKIYGLGMHRTTFWLDDAWQRYTLFNHDAAPAEGINLYGSHPFYLVVSPSGRSHGVFLHNSNAIDVVLQPLPAVTFRAIGGILDFYFFTGPSPSDVVRQYTELIGRSFMPPYWSLGFHLCRFGYGSEEVTRAVWKRNRDAGIPMDAMWNDIDYMSNRNDFTLDPVNFGRLPKLVEDIHSAGMHYVVILDSGVSASEPEGTYPPFDDGVAAGIFVKNHRGEIFLGKVWNPNATAFPDFTNPKTQTYWTKNIRDFREVLNFDGLWIDMNEPSNFLDGAFDGCPESDLEDPPYVPGVNGGVLRKKTICMTAKHHAGLHYDLHNLYGISEHDMTYNALKDVTGKRVFTLTRSTFPGSGSLGGHWSGDVFSSWHDLTKSVPDMLSASLYGISYTGADVCGFNGNATKNLCNRWMQLGAFYPFSRNHNSDNTIEQDPAAFGEDVIKSSIKALTIRYTLLPYLYTLFYRAHVHGDTVVRPLFFEFPEDEETHMIDRAFLWGSGLYIVPVTEDHSTSVRTYLPAGKWYDWHGDDFTVSRGRCVDLNAPMDTIPILVREGIVLPTQEPAQTTTMSRNNDFTYRAFLDGFGNAEGSLFWDDGGSLDTIKNNEYGLLNFSVRNGHFLSKVVTWNTSQSPALGYVIVRGVTGEITEVVVNGKETNFDLRGGVLTIKTTNVSLNKDLDIYWLR